MDDQVLRSVVMLASEVAGKDSLGTVGIALLGIERGTGHVRDHGITATEGVHGGTQRVVAGSGLGEPDITTIASKVARLEGLGNILLDDNGTTSGVDEVRALLHLGDQLLVEHTLGLLVQRAVDGDNIALLQHLFKAVNTTAANLLLFLLAQRLVVKVQQLLAVEGLEAAQDTLTDTADSDGTDDLVLKIVLLLGDGSDIPVTASNLLVGGDEIADQDEDGHDDVLSDGDDIAAGDLGDGDTAVSGVGGIEVNVIRTNTGGNGKLQLLGLGQTLSSEVSRVEAVTMLDRRMILSCASSFMSPLVQDLLSDRVYAYGVVMIISASTSSWSNLEFSPSLSEVVTRV